MSLPDELITYVHRPDTTFQWQPQDRGRIGQTTVTTLRMTSQTWQGEPWTHTLLVFVPDHMRHPDCALLHIGADGWSADIAQGVLTAEATGMVCAFLYDIPNQPLYDGLVEDALIAYTFVQYLDTGDADWPLLFPMVKSAVRAIDAVQQFCREQSVSPSRFFVTGASKRGWTTWLTAVADERVAAILPQVYDNLNIPAQLPHQLTTWGGFSEQISDYTAAGLPERMGSEEGQRLVAMVDPYTYRDRLTLPKLIINGSNDRYWATDALNLYWDSLSGPRYILYVPNSGHNLQDSDRVHATALAFLEAAARKTSLPELAWEWSSSQQSVHLDLTSDLPARAVRLWTARSPDRDFRPAAWTSTLLRHEAGTGNVYRYVGEVALPRAGHLAAFGEAEFESGSRTYTLSTQMCIR